MTKDLGSAVVETAAFALMELYEKHKNDPEGLPWGVMARAAINAADFMRAHRERIAHFGRGHGEVK